MIFKLLSKSFLLVLVSAILFLPYIVLAQKDSSGDESILFYGNGCPHCLEVEAFLEENGLNDELIQKEVYQNPQNAQEFNAICEEEGIDFMDRGVPFLYSEGECFIGDKQIISYFENKDGAGRQAQEIKEGFSQNLTMPILIGAALVDAINPCAFAVLLILMTTVLVSGNRKRALFSGLAFSASIFLSYLLMGLGLYSIVANIETSKVFMRVVGILAIILGLLNLKDFFWYGRGFLMEVPMSWRPKMKKLITSITSPFGAFSIGFLVSLFLLPCTSGPYIVIIGMLGQTQTYLKAFWLLVLYNLIFTLPMIGITLGAYFGMDVHRAEEKRSRNLRALHLIAGIIMLGMGFALILGWV